MSQISSLQKKKKNLRGTSSYLYERLVRDNFHLAYDANKYISYKLNELLKLYEIKCPDYETTIWNQVSKLWNYNTMNYFFETQVKSSVKLNLEIMKTWIWNLKCWKSKLNEKNCNLVHHIYYQIKNYFQINKEVDYNGAILKMA